MKFSRVTAITTVVLILMLLAGTVLAGGVPPRHDFSEAPTTSQQTDYVVVTFRDSPAASYTGGIPGLERTKPERGRFDPNSRAAQAYLRHLENEHANFRSWLARNAPQVQIVREFFVTQNAVAVERSGASQSLLARGPGVERVEYSWLYRPTMNVSVDLISASDLWNALGGQAAAGEGIKVGIIDSGIDATHEFFACKGDIPSKVYASGVAFDTSNVLVFDHGTHVAGTTAGCVTTPSTGVISATLSGVAPGADLFDYNVFPGYGAGFVAFGGSAFSHDIAAAVEDALLDGMDVVNMSLSGTVQGPHDFLADAVNVAADAGLVVIVAGGNAGPGDMTVGSPGSAVGALTAGASTNAHYIGIPVILSGGNQFGAAAGDFDPFEENPVSGADFALAEPNNGCAAITNNVAGQVALIDRGACSFTTKVRNAETAGAIGVIVINNVAGDPVAMGHDGTDPFPTIPAVMVGLADRTDLVSAAGTQTVSIDGAVQAEILTNNGDIIAGFSGRGPSPFNYLIKPDLTAPGVNIYSSVFEGEYAMFQGTSMASPHLAGSAALLLDLHPDWSPADVKSALVNTADRVVTTNGTTLAGVLARGGGRANLAAAMNTPLTIDPVSASFGYWSGNRDINSTLDLTVYDVSGSGQTCSVVVTGDPMVTASSNSLDVSAGGTAALSLSLAAGRSAGSGDYSGDVEITCGSTTLLVPWWVRIDRQGKP